MVSHAAVDKQLSLEVDDSGTSTVADVSPATSDIESASVHLIDEDVSKFILAFTTNIA